MIILAKILCLLSAMKAIIIAIKPSFISVSEVAVKYIYLRFVLLTAGSVFMLYYSRVHTAPIAVHWIVSVYSILFLIVSVLFFSAPDACIKIYSKTLKEKSLRLYVSFSVLAVSIAAFMLI